MRQFKGFLLCLMLVGGWALDPAALAQAAPSPSVAATVGGVQITRASLKIKKNEKPEMVDKRLAWAVKKIVYNQTVQAFGIKATDEEIKERWELITKHSGAPLDPGARAGIEYMIVDEKVNAEIEKSIRAGGHDFDKYLWWKTRYQKAEIKILDDSLKGALKYLNP